MRIRLLYCQLGLLLTVLLSRCNAFQRYTSTVHGSILCLFATNNKEAFHYHLRLADFLSRYHDVTVVGVLPIPAQFRHSNFKYAHLFNTESSTQTYEPTNRFMKLYYQSQQFAELGKYYARLLDAYPPGTFNLVIVAYYYNLRHLLLAGCFKAPIILTTETPPSFITNWEVGNPREESYLASEFAESRFISNSYSRRLIDMIIDKFIEWIISGGLDVFYRMHRNSNLHFNCQNIRMTDVRRNISLVFTNNHFSQGSIRPNVPTMVEIGGIQISEHRMPLPQYIADHINKAKHGVIYVNLGKGANCTDLPKELLDSLYEVLVESQRHVLWRWSHCTKPRQGSKIIYTLWMPQNDILAQKKVELFITHGSLSSLGEGQYHAVPMLGVTYSSELVGNVDFLVKFQLAQRIDAYNTNTDEIRSKLYSMLNDQSYQVRAAVYSLRYRDRHLTPRETVLYWVNYVLRYKGTQHMRSPAAEMSQLQMLGLDLVIFTFSIIYLTWRFRGFLWSCLTGRMMGNIRKFLRKLLFRKDYEIVIEKYSKIRYDEAVVDAARECQIRPQTVKDPDAPRVVPVKTARQRKLAARRKR